MVVVLVHTNEACLIWAGQASLPYGPYVGDNMYTDTTFKWKAHFKLKEET